MPRILAIDWDRHEVRGVLISAGATGTSVAGAWAASARGSASALCDESPLCPDSTRITALFASLSMSFR